jgi:hypothetical protein
MLIKLIAYITTAKLEKIGERKNPDNTAPLMTDSLMSQQILGDIFWYLQTCTQTIPLLLT